MGLMAARRQAAPPAPIRCAVIPARYHQVAWQAIREYVENHSRAELLDQVLDEELPRYAEALERLAQ
jgi:hypothetical protein